MHRSNQVVSFTWHDLNVEVREPLMDSFFALDVLDHHNHPVENVSQFSSRISLHYHEACVRRAGAPQPVS
jgi:hypothetical protein